MLWLLISIAIQMGTHNIYLYKEEESMTMKDALNTLLIVGLNHISSLSYQEYVYLSTLM